MTPTTEAASFVIWDLSDAGAPLLHGLFILKDGVGVFKPNPDSFNRATSLDPIHWPSAASRSSRVYRERKLGGLFGVLRDAVPEGFALGRLEAQEARDLSRPQDRLLHVGPDAVGAIGVSRFNPDQPQDTEPPFFQDVWRQTPLFLQDWTDKIVSDWRLTDDPQGSDWQAKINASRTSLGGERPKFTAFLKTHEDPEPQLWIVKPQSAGDAPGACVREWAAMTLASEAGLDAAPVRLDHLRLHDRVIQAVWVKRFDRIVDSFGIRAMRRLPYLSAHTLLDLDTPMRDDPRRSYVSLLHAMRRLCAEPDRDAQELWRRMVFNGLIGNADDHPRNHGFIRGPHGWRLSPAFDIAPHTVYTNAHAMAFEPYSSPTSPRSTATLFDWRVDRLVDLAASPLVNLSRRHAVQFIRQTRDLIQDRSPQLLSQGGTPSPVLWPASQNIHPGLSDQELDAVAQEPENRGRQKHRGQRRSGYGR